MSRIDDRRVLDDTRNRAGLPGVGDLRERVTIERVTSTDDGSGGYTRVWTPLVTRWAAVIPTGGRETLLTATLQAIQGYKVTLRYGTGVAPEDRIRWGDLLLNVRSAADPNGRREWTVAFADAGVVTQ